MGRISTVATTVRPRTLMLQHHHNDLNTSMSPVITDQATCLILDLFIFILAILLILLFIYLFYLFIYDGYLILKLAILFFRKSLTSNLSRVFISV